MKKFKKMLAVALLMIVLTATKLLAQVPTTPPADGEYRSNGAVSLTATTNWEIASGGIWSPSASIPTGSNTITIQNGNALTVDAVLNVTGYLKFGTGLTPITTAVTTTVTSASTAVTLTAANANIAIGQLIVGAGLGASASVANISGTALTLNVSSSIPAGSTLIFYTAPIAPTLSIAGGSITIANGGTYEHCVDGGSIPTATWATGSTCKITGIIGASGTGAITGLTTGTTTGSTFHHFVYNCPYQASNAVTTFQLSNPTTNTSVILGDFTLVSTGTGSGAIRIWGAAAGTTRLFNVNGNFNLQGGSITSTGSGGPFITGTANIVVNIYGKLYITGGTFNCSSSSAAGLNVAHNLYGDFQIDGGTYAVGNAAPVAAVNFKKAGTQLFTRNGGTLSSLNFVVNSGATVEVNGTSGVIDGTNNFTINAGGTLKTANVGGVNGAITTSALKSFSPAANYVFSGTSAQATSSFINRYYARGATTSGSSTVILSQYNADIAIGQTITGSSGFAVNTTVASVGSAISISYTTLSAGTGATVPVNNTTGMLVGMYVATSGGVPLGFITAVSANTSITISTTNAAVPSGTAIVVSGQSITISANATANNTANNISIALPAVTAVNDLTAANTAISPASLTLSSPLTINGVLNLSSGSLTTAANNLTLGALASASFEPSTSLNITGGTTNFAGRPVLLKSTVAGSARIAAITGDNVTTGLLNASNVTTQVYIPANRRTNRFLSHPFTTALNMSSLIDNIFVTGIGGASNGFDATTTNNPSAFWYNNATAAWVAFTSTTADNSWTQYRGIRTLVRGDRTQTTALTGANPAPNAVTLDMTGALNTGTASVAVPTGYSVVGNPYPSSIDLGTRLSNTTNIGTQYWFWDANAGPTAGAYRVKVVGTPSTPIAASLSMNAAFVVNPSAATSIAFVEADKTATDTAKLFRSINTKSGLLELQVLYNDYPADNMFVRFNKSASINKDVLDGEKLINSEVNFYAISADNKKISLDTRPFADSSVIALGFTATKANSFKIKVQDKGVDEDIYLKDKFLNTITKLDAGTEYPFNVNATAASQGESRFELMMKQVPVLQALATTFSVKLSPNPAKDLVNVSFSNEEALNTIITISNAEGKVVKTVNAGNVQSAQISINVKAFAKGSYYVILNNGKQVKTGKLQVQ